MEILGSDSISPRHVELAARSREGYRRGSKQLSSTVSPPNAGAPEHLSFGGDDDEWQPRRVPGPVRLGGHPPVGGREISQGLNRIKLPHSGGMTLGELLQQLVHQAREDNLRAHAGNLAFHGLFALFALLILAFSLLGVFGARGLIADLIEELSGPLPNPVVEVMRENIFDSTRSTVSEGVTLQTATAVLASLYGLAATARSVIDGMNMMYEVKESRSLLRHFLLSTAMALVVLILFLSATVLFLLGPRIGGGLFAVLRLENFARNVLIAGRWPLLVVLLLFVYALVYWSAPAISLRFRLFTHGSITALILWLGFTFVFSFLVEVFGSYNATYGALAGVVLLLLYMFFSSFILFIGAEINDIVSRSRGTSPGGVAPGLETRSAQREKRASV